MLGLRPPGLEFRVLCLEDNVISIISPSSGGSLGQALPICAHFFKRTPWDDISFGFNPLIADTAYIRVFIFYSHIKYPILNMFKIKCDINQQDLNSVDLILSNLNNFHSLEVVDRVSETQLQVGKNSN